MKKTILFLCVFAVIRVFGQPNFVPTNGLLGWWPLDGNAIDQSGIQAPGTLVNAPVPIVGHLNNAGGALRFNGTNHVDIPNAANLSNFPDMSISLWVRTNGNANIAGLVTKWFQTNACPNATSPPTNADTYGVWMVNTNAIDYTNNNNVFSGFPAPPTINLNQWTHVVVTSDNIGQQNMYINAVLTAQDNLVGNICTTTGPLIFGAESMPGTGGGIGIHRNFVGDLDDIGIWNRVLTLCEIENLFHSSFMYTNSLYSTAVSSANDVTLCLNASTSTIVSASANFPPAANVNYQWTQLGSTNVLGTLQSISVNPQTTTSYEVLMGAQGQCPISDVVQVTIDNNCCSQPTAGLTVLNSLNATVLNGGSYLVTNNINVTNATANTLNNLELLMMPNVKITVPNNTSLVLNNTHLYACGIKMWDGIELQDGSFFVSNGSNLIEDAKVAIDIPNTSLATTQNSPPNMNFSNMIFNKNYIGIRIRNASAAITQFPLPVTGCVFTCRNIPFVGHPNSNLSWPTTATTGNGLRVASSSTTGLVPPYNLQGAAFTNLKQPYNTISAYVGVQIIDVGNTAAQAPSPGVVMGTAIPGARTSPGAFNLFDGLGVGVEITDASFTTMNNVFQNMNNFQVAGVNTKGAGISHKITGLMNAQLDLGPNANNNQVLSLGNRFWNCWNGISTKQVYKIILHHSLFRSTHHVNSGFSPGAVGTIAESNRFNYKVYENEFSNITYNLWLNVASGNYNMGNGLNTGVYADNIEIMQNYFGPEVNSTNPVLPGGNYSYYGIAFNAANTTNWNVVGRCNILSNKLDRIYNGIKVQGSANYPVEIGGNLVNLRDSVSGAPFSDQYGIYALNNQGELIINQNELNAQGVGNSKLKLIRVAGHNSNGIGQYPQVTLNKVSNAFVGFAFEGPQPDTRWECNQLYTPLNYGISLEAHNGSPGIIGDQGNACLESGNEYLPQGNWVIPNYFTRTMGGSNPAQSRLYVALFQNPPIIPQHASVASPLYVNSVANIPGSGTFVYHFNGCGGQVANDCLYSSSYPSLPSNRTMLTTGESISISLPDMQYRIIPNPSNGSFSISGFDEAAELTYVIVDVTGKQVQEGQISKDATNKTVNVSLSKGLYFIDIRDSAGNQVRKKLLIE